MHEKEMKTIPYTIRSAISLLREREREKLEKKKKKKCLLVLGWEG